MVQKLYFWLTRSEHKGSSYASWRSPTGEASIPSWMELMHTGGVSLLFISHYHFHTGLSHLAFGWFVLFPSHSHILKVQVKWSVRQSAHKLALFNVCSRTLLGPEDAKCRSHWDHIVKRVLQLLHSVALFSSNSLQLGQIISQNS